MPSSPPIENSSKIGRIGFALWQGWEWVLQACFALLCLRFIGAALRETHPDVWPTVTLTAGAFLLAVWRPRPALYAFTLFATLLVGLRQATLLTLPSPAALVFSALWLGTLSRRLWETIRHNHSPAKAPLEGSHRTVFLICNFLTTALILSLVAQTWPLSSKEEFRAVFFGRATFSFGDPYYFLGSAFLWLQGFFYFRLLVAPLAPRPLSHASSATVPSDTETDSPSSWINAFFCVLAVTIAVGFLFQAITHVPAKPRFFAGLPLSSSLPFEDWHSFGSITAAVFAYSLVGWPKLARLPRVVIAGILLIMVISSWSRAAWMGAIIALLIVIGRKFPLRLSVGVIALALGSIVTLHLARSDQWTADQNPILYRLGNLVRIDQPRLDLYHKALGMIQDRPVLGHGIGSSYRTSVHYARPGDPLAAKPDFLHNFLLQIAAEQGLLIMALFAGFILMILKKGFRMNSLVNPAGGNDHRATRYGATLALTTYLITQLTANSLNIYASNQFIIFLFLATVNIHPKATQSVSLESPNSSQVYS